MRAYSHVLYEAFKDRIEQIIEDFISGLKCGELVHATGKSKKEANFNLL